MKQKVIREKGPQDGVLKLELEFLSSIKRPILTFTYGPIITLEKFLNHVPSWIKGHVFIINDTFFHYFKQILGMFINASQDSQFHPFICQPSLECEIHSLTQLCVRNEVAQWFQSLLPV